MDAAAAGLKAAGHAVACAVGDYDGDGLNDLAVALDEGVLLFRNLGKGKFQDVTAEAGLAPRIGRAGITFVDYDHDGDLDLFLTGAPMKDGRCAECACGAITATRHLPNGLSRRDWAEAARRRRRFLPISITIARWIWR